ncbi:glycogen debranching protein GlgX [Tropicimonas sp. IMCC6043]|uniref:glycogen debranching protein GlgX n=1 Tax=Tropicimonas sp. IMCC6043 TaxID=2510645 RepID=UPI00101B9697|nr:glycogen debranching protein GlgX [Tropicimonas sp. IMCC6043]RYH11160.1 glycogen debranching enzyme GlgX [Tropicimonas sp. IMCC6043]
MRHPEFVLSAGRPAPLGATFDGDGVNFAVFSQHATAMEVCLFSEDGRKETQRLRLAEREGDVWYGYVSGLRPGQYYGLRAHGPYRPDEGHRFNPNKLLLDPYAKRLTGKPVWHDALMGYRVGSNARDLSFDTRDSAPYMPRCVVEDTAFSWGYDHHPRTPIEDTIIYETHVKGFTQLHPKVAPEGTFLGLSTDPMLEYFSRLGITAIELLPVQSFLTDRFLEDKGLSNYWGYQTLGFFAPDPRYLSEAKISEFQQMVARLHHAGIEIILDVVYNHTCEGSELGPTLSFRGLDNRSYYRLIQDKRYYINDTGTGNTLNLDHPMVLRMVMDSLRYWVQVMHVDGFRFDLCSTLGRTDFGFDPGASFFDAIRQDPVLTHVKLIAEPWDIGPGGYRLGGFPPPFHEWNDRFRDGVRRFWRGDPGRAPDLAGRLTGSAAEFDHSGRPATASVNLITAHDGFTLEDVVSYNGKHNLANGEDNRDGHSENYSDNFGWEGPTDDAKIKAARDRRKRAMLATLMLSQGTPMLLAGDEMGHSQKGNNNAYCQDNEISWIDWDNVDEALTDFTADLIKFRREHPILRQKVFLHSRERRIDGREDLFWWRADGKPMSTPDWVDPGLKLVCVEMRTASNTPIYAATENAIFAVFNAGEDAKVRLPTPPKRARWLWAIDSAEPGRAETGVRKPEVTVESQSVAVFVLEHSA